jgi:hypothetical protein
MITAEKVSKLASLNKDQLEGALTNAGYSMLERPLQSKFVGITNSGDFCYQFSYKDSDTGLLTISKLFVNIDATGNIVAEY